MTRQSAVIFAPGASGPDPTTFQILAVRAGLHAVRSRMRLNRAYTPRNLRLTTEKLTGLKFRPRDYDGMIAALTALLPPESRAGRPRREQSGIAP